MDKVTKSLKDKRFRYGSFSTVMILFAIALFLLVNLVVGQLNITTDLTKDKMYSLSEYTKEFLAELEQDVTIYALFRTGQEDLMFKQLLEEYAASSPRVTVVYRDPVLYPSFVEHYQEPDQTIAVNSVIVESGEKFKVVPASDMMTTEVDYNTFQEYVTSIDIEPQVSNAINYVTLGETPVIYNVTGNNEYGLPENLIKQLGLANYEVRDADLVTGEIPEDCDILAVTTPARDWSTDEAGRILKYLQSDGKALFVLGMIGDNFPNLSGVLSAYGVGIGDYVVLEGDASHYYSGAPSMIIPSFNAHDITQNFIDNNYVTMLFQPTGVNELSIKKTSTVIEPLLTTTASSYGKNDPNAATVNKEPGDVEGPFSLAVAVTDAYFTEEQHTTKMVVLSAEFILEESFNGAVSGTNWDFLVNSVNWMQGEDTGIYIPSKSPSSSSMLTMTQSQVGMIVLFSAIILPAAILIIGLVIWLRRRHN